MSHPLIILPAAEDDLAEARDWYDAQQDGLGIEFLAAIEDVFDRIQATPELYAREYQGHPQDRYQAISVRRLLPSAR